MCLDLKPIRPCDHSSPASQGCPLVFPKNVHASFRSNKWFANGNVEGNKMTKNTLFKVRKLICCMQILNFTQSLPDKAFQKYNLSCSLLQHLAIRRINHGKETLQIIAGLWQGMIIFIKGLYSVCWNLYLENLSRCSFWWMKAVKTLHFQCPKSMTPCMAQTWRETYCLFFLSPLFQLLFIRHERMLCVKMFVHCKMNHSCRQC